MPAEKLPAEAPTLVGVSELRFGLCAVLQRSRPRLHPPDYYGSKETFTDYVRGPLCDELLGPITRSPGLERYSLLIISPALALAGEVTLAYWKAGAPTEVLLLYVVSHVVESFGTPVRLVCRDSAKFHLL